jgi:hypothetical protein
MKLCKLGELLASLPDPHRLALQTALGTSYKEGGFSDAKLSYEITQAGFEVSYNMVNLHRRQVCRCEWG